MEFKPMPKIRRNALTMYVTEKLDGTNASIHIFDIHDHPDGPFPFEMFPYQPTAMIGDFAIYTASRKRWIAPAEDNPGEASDNFGFALWVKENAAELVKLGVGVHFGEWVGEGIQKNPHELEGKFLYLFNHYRWGDAYKATQEGHDTTFPKCAHVVPHLTTHVYNQIVLDSLMDDLHDGGSKIGGKPEGIMVYIPDADHYQKITFENSSGKWKDAA